MKMLDPEIETVCLRKLQSDDADIWRLGVHGSGRVL